MTKEKKELGISADQTNPGAPEDQDKFGETLYKRGGIHRGPNGTKYSYIGASSEEEVKSLHQRGWKDTLEEALFPKKAAAKS